MPMERTDGGSSLIDVLDRVLDKGIVLDAWVKVSLAGIDFRCVERHLAVVTLSTRAKASASPLPSASPLAMLAPRQQREELGAPSRSSASASSKQPRRNRATSC